MTRSSMAFSWILWRMWSALGLFPVMICTLMGRSGHSRRRCGWLFLSLCGVIRLAFFNVLETNRQTQPDSGEKVYHGLPITSIAVILPLTFLLGFCMNECTFRWVLMAMLVITGFLFILDFRAEKAHQFADWAADRDRCRCGFRGNAVLPSAG